jgi:trimethylamine:corrinoid methyltransferase-like protein
MYAGTAAHVCDYSRRRRKVTLQDLTGTLAL